jgi:hypothetical protein
VSILFLSSASVSGPFLDLVCPLATNATPAVAEAGLPVPRAPTSSSVWSSCSRLSCSVFWTLLPLPTAACPVLLLIPLFADIGEVALIARSSCSITSVTASSSSIETRVFPRIPSAWPSLLAGLLLLPLPIPVPPSDCSCIGSCVKRRGDCFFARCSPEVPSLPPVLLSGGPSVAKCKGRGSETPPVSETLVARSTDTGGASEPYSSSRDISSEEAFLLARN